MTRRLILTCLLTTGLLAPALVYAEHTHFWRQSDYSEFEKGTAKGVAIRSDGKLVPAPQFAAFSDPNLLYLWALRTDSRGRRRLRRKSPALRRPRQTHHRIRGPGTLSADDCIRRPR